jgi:type II secretory pathway pseudopilin PulG
MKKLIKLKLAASQEQGFITLEVIVGILVAFFFLMGAMQSLVYAMALKVQAQEKQRASQLITGDIELANDLANSNDLVVDSADFAATCNATTYANGFGNKLWDKLELPENKANLTEFTLSDGNGQQLALERTPVSQGNSNVPHRTLKVRYQVWWGFDGTNYLNRKGDPKGASDKPIAETYVEIIPDVALACP